jgi:hypothetical protein
VKNRKKKFLRFGRFMRFERFERFERFGRFGRFERFERFGIHDNLKFRTHTTISTTSALIKTLTSKGFQKRGTNGVQE